MQLLKGKRLLVLFIGLASCKQAFSFLASKLERERFAVVSVIIHLSFGCCLCLIKEVCRVKLFSRSESKITDTAFNPYRNQLARFKGKKFIILLSTPSVFDDNKSRLYRYKIEEYANPHPSIFLCNILLMS